MVLLTCVGLGLAALFQLFELVVDILFCFFHYIFLILLYKIQEFAVVSDDKRTARHSKQDA